MGYVGKLLVAPPAMNDDYWAKTVIFIYEQNLNNTMGVILNKPSDRDLRDLLMHHSLDYAGEEKLMIGGPVNGSALVMLHSTDWSCTNTLDINGDYSLSSDRTMLTRMANGDQPNYWGMYMGMCGWSLTQLERELSRPRLGWLVAPPKLDVVFDTNSNQMWHNAIDLAAEQMTTDYFSIE